MPLRSFFILPAIIISSIVFADSIGTGAGKIVFTQGHHSPNCRIVKYKSNLNGEIKTFRIANTNGDDDVNSVILAALVSRRNVNIHYNPSITTGCGSEPKILYVTIY